MPAAPKSPSSASATRKAPKAKGAKCDEKPDDQGRCETCVRLRLQCLGFGAKRPDWLRESQNVTDLRDKIKTFLASQGMIKGHSGPSQRTQSHPEEPQEERATLKLASEGYPSSASESPPANLLVLSSSAEENIRHAQVSNVRSEDGWSGAPFPTSSMHENHPVLHHSPQATRAESPPFNGNANGFQEQQYDPSLMTTTTHNSTTIAPPPCKALYY
ncbi:hypothetical protein PQX77_005190 [Marasmius sp. AFHP31]|nr:hypothetical protein PQX77_005190 [Marasmius sp. AFHP31]